MKQAVLSLTLLIVLIVPINLSAQQSPESLNYYVSADYNNGFILPHHKAFNYFIKGYAKSINLSVAKQADGSKHWHKLYNRPYFGLAYNHTNFGNNSELGHAHSLYPFIAFSLFDKHKISSNLQLAAGFAWINKHFDIHENVYNIAIGSHLNAYLNFNINVNLKLNDKFGLSSALGFTHFSNGGTHQPNKGLNVISLNLGLKHYFKKTKQVSDNKDIILKTNNKKYLFSFIVASGFKTLEPALTKTYFVHSLQFNTERNLGNRHRIGVGIDFFNDNSVVDYLRFKKIIETAIKLGQEKDNYYAGAHFSYDLVFGKTSFTIQTGAYFWQKAKSFQDIYHRFGLKYRFSKHWLANLTLKTFWAAADFAEWGIGYVF